MTHQIIELMATSTVGMEDAVNNAFAKATQLHGQFDWYEVVETKKADDMSKKTCYHVYLKIGCQTH